MDDHAVRPDLDMYPFMCMRWLQIIQTSSGVAVESNKNCISCPWCLIHMIFPNVQKGLS